MAGQPITPALLRLGLVQRKQIAATSMHRLYCSLLLLLYGCILNSGKGTSAKRRRWQSVDGRERSKKKIANAQKVLSRIGLYVAHREGSSAVANIQKRTASYRLTSEYTSESSWRYFSRFDGRPANHTCSSAVRSSATQANSCDKCGVEQFPPPELSP